MAEATGANKFISKVNSGFPPHLDWERLRALGLDHIGKLSGKLWTDHNVHDPGVTILEILCYALMDLGYRTSLPTVDILARNPDLTGKDDNFLSPSEILTCNPVTITDFRKLLIDIPGVRNAWLTDSFYPCTEEDTLSQDKREPFCPDCYNGLYRVYIETESQDTNPNSPGISDLLNRIREKLIAHRNLCEDFIDIRILCKKKVGLCGDIELEKDADAERVYLAAVNALTDFFSPAPRFYTLKQLLIEKNKTVEEIYAGRPYDLKESHGFVDTEELERLQLRKEIHFSDVYQVLLKVPGIRNVTRLAWRKGSGPCLDKADWTFNIPPDHVLEFSPETSEFTFVRQGIPVSLDTAQFNEFFKLNLSYSGKVLYKSPSPYLDLDMPTGVFRPDLGEYQSVQNDFPRVYGLNEGGLPSTASNRRKAQAYQLKGYLLFFDQLLANYLAQLQNLRSLFSFASPDKKTDKRTYFINQQTEIPDIDKLLRFNNSNDNSSIPGVEGDILARPVYRRELEELISEGNKTPCEPIGTPYFYKEYCAMEYAIQNWHQDLSFAGDSPITFSTSARCWRFFLISSSDTTVALLSNRIYSSEAEARQAAESTIYAAAHSDNFRRFEDSGAYSFTLDLRLSSYLQYLQGIVENKSLYLERQGQFLDHLLSRFAERFTDFALISFGAFNERQLKEQDLRYKATFLQHYGDLSSNRGRAYDYLRDGWNNQNLSGFEKRAMALAGMGTLKRKHLCNYVVERFEEYYQIVIKLASGDILFTNPEKFYSRESAELALKELLGAIRKPESYSVVSDNPPFMVKLQFADDKYAMYTRSFATREDALLSRRGLIRMFDVEPEVSDVVDHRIVVRPNLKDVGDRTAAECTLTFDDDSKFRDHVREHPDFFRHGGNWTRFEPYPQNADMIYDERNNVLINWNAFSFYSRRNIVRKPGKFGYELLDSENTFRLVSEIPHDSEADAEQSAKELVKSIASDPDSLLLVEDNDEYHLEVRTEEVIHVKTEESKDRLETLQLKRNIIRIIQSHVYPIVFVPEASTWKFRFVAGHESEQFAFTSRDEYGSKASALEDATLFLQNVTRESLQVNERKLALDVSLDKNKSIITEYNVEDAGRIEAIRQKVQEYLTIRSEIKLDLSHPEELSEKYIINDIGDARRQWVYRLVDKDNLLALYKPDIDSNEPQSVEAKRKSLYQDPPAYQFTDIVLSQQAIASTGQEHSIQKYYYRIIASQDNNTDLTLFESVKRFGSSEEAWEAFQENYSTILSKARNVENYGKGKVISLEPISEERSISLEHTSTLVYVPDATKELYSWHDHIAIDALVKIANQYPVRYITREEDEFYQLFKCEEDNRDKPIVVCPTPKEGIRYYYFVLTDKDGIDLWQSTQYFTSRQEAIEQFRFFLILLKYPGNFTIIRDYCECKPQVGNPSEKPCVCRWKIWIREVLAESRKRFISRNEAWMELERFICIAQSGNSFHAFQRTEDCSHTFDIMCPSGLVHPVAYHSEKQRNEAMGKLHEAFGEFQTRQFPALNISNNEGQLINSRNEIIADITLPPGRSVRELCLADVFYKLVDNFQHYNKESGIILRGLVDTPDAEEAVTIKPHDPEMDPFDWATLLNEASDLYPIVRKDDGKYYVTIRLRGFGLLTATDPDQDHDVTCNRYAAAWEGLCCFDTCREARTYLTNVQVCLAELSNYRGVYDCECGPYRIQLICECDDPSKRKRDEPNVGRNVTEAERPVDQPCCNEIIAYNPQRYHTPKMNCTAMTRAKALINSEGLHVVEHILLRPRCPEDCRGNNFPKLTTCPEDKAVKLTDEKLEWRSTWTENAVDNSNEPIELQPGKDPYSFIATVFLPAWPQRFRSKANRLIIENLLYRETPAHIMLRIFWLRPIDFCEFESLFKHWHVWISQGKFGHCLQEDPTAQLVDLLINREFREMETCEPCTPCKPPVPLTAKCFEDEDDPCKGVTVLKKINDLFCWKNGTQPLTEMASFTRAEDQPPPTAAAPDPADLKAKRSVFNSRLTRYKSQIKTNTQVSKNPLAKETELFLNKPKPDREQFLSLARRILKKESASRSKIKMDRAEQHTLFETLVFFYLDKVVFYGKTSMMGEPLHEFFSTLDARKINKKNLFERWNATELGSLERGVTVDEVRELIR